MMVRKKRPQKYPVTGILEKSGDFKSGPGVFGHVSVQGGSYSPGSRYTSKYSLCSYVVTLIWLVAAVGQLGRKERESIVLCYDHMCHLDNLRVTKQPPCIYTKIIIVCNAENTFSFLPSLFSEEEECYANSRMPLFPKSIGFRTLSNFS